MNDLSRLKEEISLPHYAAFIGYALDKKKSTRKSIVMRCGTSDKIIISRRGNIWVYFSPYDDKDNGTIIDFIQHRTQQSIKDIIRELTAWHGGNVELPTQYYTNRDNPPDPARIKRLFNACSLATDHDYLKSRGITEKAFRSPLFAGRVFQDRYKNAVFPHFRSGHVCALELKGAYTGLLARGSEKSLWRSNIKKDDHAMIIAEAPIDALSYHMLHDLKSAFYVATSGGVSPSQLRLIDELLAERPVVETIRLIVDHDKGGDRISERINAHFDSNFLW